MPIRKSVGGFKDKVIGLFKTNSSKKTLYERGKKLSKPKIQNKIRNPFILIKKKYRIKDRITRDIWALFEQQEEEETERNKLEKESN